MAPAEPLGAAKLFPALDISVEGLKLCCSVTKYQGFWWLWWVLAALQRFGHLWQLLPSSGAAAIAFKLMMQLGLI